MKLKAIYNAQDEIPEKYIDLYTEKNGQWEFTGVEGLKTTADIDRLKSSLNMERNDHKAVKDKLAKWGDLDYEEVHKKLDRIDELEAAAGGSLDEEKIEKIVQGRIKAQIAPLERSVEALTTENTELKTVNQNWETKNQTRIISDSIRKAAIDSKVVTTALEDAIAIGSRVFEILDDGKVVTKDNSGVTPGIDAASWLSDMQKSRPHWWPASNGGGGKGNLNPGGGLGDNPWAKDTWNVTKQGAIIKEKGIAQAKQLAEQAGSSIGATKPTETN